MCWARSMKELPGFTLPGAPLPQLLHVMFSSARLFLHPSHGDFLHLVKCWYDIILIVEKFDIISSGPWTFYGHCTVHTIFWMIWTVMVWLLFYFDRIPSKLMKGSSNSDDFTVFYPSVDLAPLKGFCPLFWLVISISFSPHDQSLIFCSHLDFSNVLLDRVLPALHSRTRS